MLNKKQPASLAGVPLEMLCLLPIAPKGQEASLTTSACGWFQEALLRMLS